jgi:hypothetical protein
MNPAGTLVSVQARKPLTPVGILTVCLTLLCMSLRPVPIVFGTVRPVRPPMADWWLGSRSVLHAGRGPLKYYHVGDSASSPPRRSAQEQTARRAYERTHHGRVAYRSGPRRSAFPFVVSGCSRHNWAVRF